jgi:hypothetical protein
VLTLQAQCLPVGSLLVFDFEGGPPVSAALSEGGPGICFAMLPAGSVVPGANLLQTRVVGPLGDTVAICSGQVEVTATGRASEPPPEEPAVMRVRSKTKSNQRNDRWSDGMPESTSADGRSLSFELFFDGYEDDVRSASVASLAHACADEGEGKGEPHQVRQQSALVRRWQRNSHGEPQPDDQRRTQPPQR